MTPRIDAAYLSLDQPIKEVLRIVRSSPWSRFPLCDGDLDHTLGLIHVRDLFNHLELQLDTVDSRPVSLDECPREEHQEMQTRVVGKGDLNLRSIMRPIIIVPEQAPVSGLLRQFQESRTHMAILVDEYGVAEGIVTLEDILEEVVGEIEDEFDRKSASQISLEGDTYVISGSVPLHELQDRIGLALEAEDVDTLGGYIVQELDRLPKVGDRLEFGNYTARVTSVDRWRVTGVELRKRTGSLGHGKE
jgi:CBS domain containing-hemolysin-like protein